MQIHDIQVALSDSDPKQADAKFIEFVDEVLTPLLPPAIAQRVRTDAVNRETYVSKRVGGFTVAMRTESAGGEATRWLWVFRGTAPARNFSIISDAATRLPSAPASRRSSDRCGRQRSAARLDRCAVRCEAC